MKVCNSGGHTKRCFFIRILGSKIIERHTNYVQSLPSSILVSWIFLNTSWGEIKILGKMKSRKTNFSEVAIVKDFLGWFAPMLVSSTC